MTEIDNQEGRIGAAQWSVIALAVSFAVGGVFYHQLIKHDLGHSALMFVGIPYVLVILLALTPKAKSATGGILKGITLALLIIAPLLGEGYLCILIASPLFYIVGLVVGVLVDTLRERHKASLSCVILLLLPMSIEGVNPSLSFRRSQTVVESVMIDAPVSLVEQRLASSPDVRNALPVLLRIGFPRPLAAWGSGLDAGATRTIHFAGAEGDPPGDLMMRVAEHRPGYVRFETVSDTSKLTQWLSWRSSEVEWRQVDGSRTQVTWRVHFERRLDPAWYFAPLEHAAVDQAARYLIQANVTPGEQGGDK